MRYHLLLSTAHVHVTAKPPWLTTVPGLFDASRPSASTLLFAHLQQQQQQQQQPFPASPSHLVCHRLDCATSGLLLLAASQRGASALGEGFRQGAVRKTYEALVDASQAPAGSPLRAGAAGGEVALPLGRRAGVPLLHTAAAACGGGSARTLLRAARTRWRLLEWRTPSIARLALQPLTGRTHQLRLHCALGLGAPIVGDALYGYCGGFAADLRARSAAAAAAPGSCSEEEAQYLAEADARCALPHAHARAPAPPPRLMLHAQALELPLRLLCGEAGAGALAGAPLLLGATAQLRGGSGGSGGGGGSSRAAAAAQQPQLEDCRAEFEAGAPAAGAAFAVLQGASSDCVRLELATPF